MADKPKDLVISYTVHSKGAGEEYAKLTQALSDGYRVMDVFTNAMTAPAQASGFAPVVVTVLLTNDYEHANYAPALE